MALLKVRNVGPIKNTDSLNEGFLKFDGLTVFIGDQGTGKSTLAKLFSTLSWLEKALFREDFTPKYVSQYKRFQKHLEFQNIDQYLKQDSYIEYIGTAFIIKYENEKVKIKAQPSREVKEYDFPKIMYVPAERNFVSTIDRPDLIKRLPMTIFSFLEEYEYAKRTLKGTIQLPIQGVTFEYRRQSKKSWIMGKDYNGAPYKLDLLAASSGFQSLVPMYLVTKSLSNIIAEKGSAKDDLTFERAKKFNDELARILANSKLDDDAKEILIEQKLRTINYTSFVNIVEEPEQNLFPTSQKNILYDLFKNTNKNENNKLILTTHSPYIINYLTLAIKAFTLKRKTLSKEETERMSKIVPLNAAIDPKRVAVYQINNSGIVEELESYKGLPSDENLLNELLGDFNDDFVELLKLEG